MSNSVQQQDGTSEEQVQVDEHAELEAHDLAEQILPSSDCVHLSDEQAMQIEDSMAQHINHVFEVERNADDPESVLLPHVSSLLSPQLSLGAEKPLSVAGSAVPTLPCDTEVTSRGDTEQVPNQDKLRHDLLMSQEQQFQFQDACQERSRVGISDCEVRFVPEQNAKCGSKAKGVFQNAKRARDAKRNKRETGDDIEAVIESLI